jgi:hypothetical protein
MKAYVGMDVSIQVFLSPTLVGGQWSLSRHGRFSLAERGLGGPQHRLGRLEVKILDPTGNRTPTPWWSSL